MSFQIILATILLVAGCRKKEDDNISPSAFELNSLRAGSYNIDINGGTQNVPVNAPIVMSFNRSVNQETVNSSVTLISNADTAELTFSFLDQSSTISALHADHLLNNTTYTLNISSGLRSTDGIDYPGKSISFTTEPATLHIDSIVIGGVNVTNIGRPSNIPLNFSAQVYFDAPLNPGSVSSSTVRLNRNNIDTPLNFTFSSNNQILQITGLTPLVHFDKYLFILNTGISGAAGEILAPGINKSIYTAIDETPKFPVVSDDELLTIVQEQTFKYFWDFGHPVSGLAPERNATPNVCTIGGSGFGVMAMIVGIERNFITRAEGVQRWTTIVDFLTDQADRFHGVWPHWVNGSTGDVVPFSPQDNGADLVESSYMIHGLLTVREYLNPSTPSESELIDKINTLWNEVEWDWFTQGGQDVLYWHWSPNLGWAMNHQIKGYNECLITYFLAACSPTHPIDASVYHNGWANSSYFINGQNYVGYSLPLGYPYGGPLFFAHYSFLGFNPNNLSDTYANYWEQNVNHSLINYTYCVNNPGGFVGYSDRCWGLTASDNYEGYNAHSPTNDLGVITPTAALSSMPYTPTQSMNALRFFYYTIGDKIWGEYGFYDAFSTTNGWYGDSFLAIDQGPIIVMIENHRSGLCWDLFMDCPEVAVGMTMLGFNN